MDDKIYRRLVQTSVTCFLRHGEHYLFLKRHENKRIDPGLLNGVGGRLEPHENYLDAAIRETDEETGYVVSIGDVHFCGIVKLEGGYEEDWVMGFFTIDVPHMNIPLGTNTDDGKLIWLREDEILAGSYDLVDDLHYCMNDIIAGKEIFFINGEVGKDHKIIHANISKLPILDS